MKMKFLWIVGNLLVGSSMAKTVNNYSRITVENVTRLLNQPHRNCFEIIAERTNCSIDNVKIIANRILAKDLERCSQCFAAPSPDQDVKNQ